jgi:hypothetical protein
MAPKFMDADDIEKMFGDTFASQVPTSEDIERYRKIRDAARVFARAVYKETPICADQTAAIRKIREAVMTANAAIALSK